MATSMSCNLVEILSVELEYQSFILHTIFHSPFIKVTKRNRNRNKKGRKNTIAYPNDQDGSMS